jgi:GTP-binding protein HflX
MTNPAPLDDSAIDLHDWSAPVELGSEHVDDLIAERQSLRRVAGISTELEDISEVEQRQLRLERVVLVGVWTSGSALDAERSMHELARLAQTAGSEVLEGVVQRRDKPDPATYIGSGKARELREIVVRTGADTVICDGELSPGQLQSLEKVVKVKVVDRTVLILDIFAQHAKSREGKAQVELAQLSYLLPRLRGWGESMSRQGGGVGTRMGGGETKIETDRRRIRNRMAKLRREIAGFERVRSTKRSSRLRHAVPAVAIAGYTNAGKSSILNRLTGAAVLADDELFATVDPTTRRHELPDGRNFTLTDTVGFVRHLPHALVESFRSTLEEVALSELVLHVVDASDEDPEEQVASVHLVLAEIGAERITEVLVLNKCDAVSPEVLARLTRRWPDAVAVSAHTGQGLEELMAVLARRLPVLGVELGVRLPFGDPRTGGLLARLHREATVRSVDHGELGTDVVAVVGPALAHELQGYSCAEVCGRLSLI